MTQNIASPTRRHHRWWIALVVGIVVVLAVPGYVVLRYLTREHPGPKSVNSVIQNFHGSTSIATDSGQRYLPPAPGVYEVKGEGTERISFPPNSQTDGSIMPASVQYLANGCWRWVLDYNVVHSEYYDFCPRGGRLLLAGFGNSQSWDFGVIKVTNAAHFICPPASVILNQKPKAAQMYKFSCIGTNSAAPGTTHASTTIRIVRTQTLRIGDRSFQAIEQHQQVTLSGGQKGTSSEDWWFQASSGLPLRMQRHITVASNSPIGTVTYDESGSWQMTSIQPRI